jgi:tetratricopeptide (TPR) repeat protein
MYKLITVLLLIAAQGIQAQEYERYKKLYDTSYVSKALGFEKQVSITVPFEWQADVEQQFPIIIIFDRQNQRSHNYMVNTIDYLTSNEAMPSAVILSISSEENYRYYETLHNKSSVNGYADKNETFIFDELLPFAKKELHASDFTLLIGHSRYGFFTTSLFCKRTNDLNAVISLSPFFTQKNVTLIDSIAALNEQNFKTTKYYRFGIGNDYPTDFHKMDSTIKLLNNPSLDTKGFFFPEADHNTTPGLTIATALYDIFEEWAKIQNIYFSNDQQDLSIMPILSQKIKSHYGSNIPFSLGYLNGKGWYFFGEQAYEKAIEAWEILLQSYPNFAEGYLYIIEAQIESKKDFSATIKKFEQALSHSTIYGEEEKIALKKELEELTKKATNPM